MLILGLVPIRIEPSCHIGDGAQLLFGIEVDTTEDDPDVLLHIPFARGNVTSLEEYTSTIGVHHAQDQLQRGGLSGTVSPNESHDGPLRNGKEDVLQRKGRIALAQPLHLQHVTHLLLPPAVSCQKHPSA